MTNAIDRTELDTQTFGDKALAREILDMFREQAPMLLQAIMASSGAARGEVAHRLKGSALAIGARTLAAAAADLEAAPLDADALARVEANVQDVLRDVAQFPWD
jgi:HPt (histidine-containing phosphotransfer) domain-containing protein